MGVAKKALISKNAIPSIYPTPSYDQLQKARKTLSPNQSAIKMPDTAKHVRKSRVLQKRLVNEVSVLISNKLLFINYHIFVSVLSKYLNVYYFKNKGFCFHRPPFKKILKCTLF